MRGILKKIAKKKEDDTQEVVLDAAPTPAYPPPQPPLSSLQDEDPPEYYDRGKGGTLCDKILLDRRLRFCVVMALAAVAAPVIVWLCVYQPATLLDNPLCSLNPEFRVPCFDESLEGPGSNPEALCTNAGCCYNTTTEECYHSLPSRHGLEMASDISWSNENIRKGVKLNPRGAGSCVDVASLRSSSCPDGWQCAPDCTKLRDATFTARRRGPMLVLEFHKDGDPPEDGGDDLPPYSVDLHSKAPLNFSVWLSATEGEESEAARLLLSNAIGATAVGEHGRWELTVRLPAGAQLLGPHAEAATSSAGEWLYPSPERPAAMPTLLTVEEGGAATLLRVHAQAPVRLRLRGRHDANILEVRVLDPRPANVSLELVAAASPKEALRLLHEADAARNAQPLPDWALGLLVCPWTQPPKFGSWEEVEDQTHVACQRLQHFLEAAEGASSPSPWDAHCADQALMWVNGSLSCLREEDWKLLANRRLLLSVPPAVHADDRHLPPLVLAEAAGQDKAHVGGYRNEAALYPDWAGDERQLQAWLQARLRAVLGDDRLAHLGGVALLDNWPLDDGYDQDDEEADGGSQSDAPPPTTTASSPEDADAAWVRARLAALAAGSLPPGARHAAGAEATPHHALHAALPAAQAAAAARAAAALAPDARLVLTAAAAARAHALPVQPLGRPQEATSWPAMRAAAAAALALGVGGAPLAAGGPACGDGADFDQNDDDHRQLCARWYQQAALLPLMWVASPDPQRHPHALPATVRAGAAVRLRYGLLPYLRGVAAEARREGVPAARYMALEFPRDRAARAVPHTQWMLGDALLVAPAVLPTATHVSVYLPDEEGGAWRFLSGGEIAAPDDEEEEAGSGEEDEEDEEDEEVNGRWASLRLGATEPVLLLRPGYIVPRANDASSAKSALMAAASGLRLTASVTCPEDIPSQAAEPCTARGQLLLQGSTSAMPLTLSAGPTSFLLAWTCQSAARADMTFDDDDNGDDGGQDVTDDGDDDGGQDVSDDGDDDGGQDVTDDGDDNGGQDVTDDGDDDGGQDVTDDGDDDGGQDVTDGDESVEEVELPGADYLIALDVYALPTGRSFITAVNVEFQEEKMMWHGRLESGRLSLTSDSVTRRRMCETVGAKTMRVSWQEIN